MPATRSKRRREESEERIDDDAEPQPDSDDELVPKRVTRSSRGTAKPANTVVKSSKPVKLRAAVFNDPDAVKSSHSSQQSQLRSLGINSTDIDLDHGANIGNGNGANGDLSTLSLSSVAHTMYHNNSTYFDVHKRNKTSAHTLALLPSLAPADLARYGDSETSLALRGIEERLTQRYERQFAEWHYHLSHGLNLLLFGFGSKIQVLKSFAFQYLMTGGSPVIFVQGYSHNFEMKHLFNLIIRDICHSDRTFRELRQQLEFLISFFNQKNIAAILPSLTLVIASIDGPSMRNPMIHDCLSLLTSQCPAVRIVASSDNVKASLLFNASQLAQYRFLYYQCTTFAPFTKECGGNRFVNGAGGSANVSVSVSGSSAHRGINAILQSLTPLHRKVMKLLSEAYVALVETKEKLRVDLKQKRETIKQQRQARKQKQSKKSVKKKKMDDDGDNDEDQLNEDERKLLEEEKNDEVSASDSDGDSGANLARMHVSNSKVGVNANAFLLHCITELLLTDSSFSSAMKELVTHDLVVERRGQHGEALYVVPYNIDEIRRYFIDEPRESGESANEIAASNIVSNGAGGDGEDEEFPDLW